MKPRSRLACLLLLFLPVVAVGLHRSSLAQDAEKPAKEAEPESETTAITLPRFEDAPVTQLLKWANATLGVGFLYTSSEIMGEDGSERRLNFLPQDEAEVNDILALVFEALRSVGLVPMPSRGISGVQYHVVGVSRAAGIGVVTIDPDELEGLWFGTLAFEASNISYDQLASIISRFASKDATVLGVAETSTIIVSDFVDNLFAIFDASTEAQTPALRDDDMITLSFRPTRQDSRNVFLALEASRTPTETFQATHHAQSSTIFLSGKRKETEEVFLRLETMDSTEIVKAEAVTLRTYNIKVRTANDLVATLRQHFEREVLAETFRVSHVSVRNQLLVECSERHWASALAVLGETDRTPRSEEEAGREQR